MKLFSSIYRSFKFSSYSKNRQSQQLNNLQKQFSTLSRQQKLKKYVAFLINSHKSDSNYVYRQSKSICQFIKKRFQSIDFQQPKSFDNNCFQKLKNITKQIHISNYQSWRAFNQVSKVINYQLNNKFKIYHFIMLFEKFKSSIEEQKAKRQKLKDIADILFNLNYQIHQNNDYRLRCIFHNQIFKKQDKIFEKQQIQNNNSLEVLQAISKHPQLLTSIFTLKQIVCNQIIYFIERQSQLIKCNRKIQIHLANIIKNFTYANWWKDQQIQNLINIISQKANTDSKNEPATNKKYKKFRKQGILSALNTLKFSSSSPVYSQNNWHKSQSILSEGSVTQNQIYNILQQFGYPIQINKSLFDFQVDYLLSGSYIIQYHGIHHYVINDDYPPKETIRSRWKKECFQKRGFKMFVIPFYQWNKLENVYDKKKWLINRLESLLLKQKK